MSLSCSCEGWEGEPGTWSYFTPNDFTKFNISGKRKKRCRCYSCQQLIDFESLCVEIDRIRSPYSEIEEKISGDEIQISPIFMCEKCGEIFLNLSAIGYCFWLPMNMADALKEYHELTGFKPEDS